VNTPPSETIVTSQKPASFVQKARTGKQIIGTEEIDDEVQGFTSEHTTGIGFAELNHHKKHHHK